MKANKVMGGSIINMCSIASVFGIKDRFAYSMSKGAALTMTYSTATDHMRDNIRCNGISPTRVHTAFVEGYLSKSYVRTQKKKKKRRTSSVSPVSPSVSRLLSLVCVCVCVCGGSTGPGHSTYLPARPSLIPHSACNFGSFGYAGTREIRRARPQSSRS